MPKPDVSSQWTPDERLDMIAYLTEKILNWPNNPWSLYILKSALWYVNLITNEPAYRLETNRSSIDAFLKEIEDGKNTKPNSQRTD